MKRHIDFFISNHRHHWQVVSAVSSALAACGHDCRVISLCELRGEQSPAPIASDVPVLRVLEDIPARTRSISTRSSATGLARQVLHSVAWHIRIAPRIRQLLSERVPDVAVVPNDLAYPFNRIVKMFRRRGLRWLLYQEGILFRLPPSNLLPYGAGGASAIAAWGEAAAEYFIKDAGADRMTVHSVGSPRHDSFCRSRFEKQAFQLRQEVPAGHKLIVFFGTTVDKPGGHCTSAGKLRSIGDFFDSLAPLMRTEPFRLWVKPHAGEELSDYRRLIRESSIADSTELRPDLHTFSGVVASDAVIVNGSSIGVESLLLGARVGVIPVPNTGYPFDYDNPDIYVQIPRRHGADQIRKLLAWSVENAVCEEYLKKHFANRPDATDAMARLLETM